MGESSTFRDLSASLPEKERKQLLSKIKDSLNVDHSEDENIYSAQLSDEERQKLITSDIQKVSWWTKFRIWLRSLFSGKNKLDIFLNLKMGALKARVKTKMPGITGFETRDLTPRFAEEVWELYLFIRPLEQFFSSLWTDTEFLEKAIQNLLRKEISNLKISLQDFITIPEMEELYSRANKKEHIREEVKKRVTEYLKDIPKETFAGIEERLLPLYYLKSMVLFPWQSFFQQFNIKESEKENEVPTFQKANAGICIEYLEKLYYGLYVVSKVQKPVSVSDEIIAQYSQNSTSGNTDIGDGKRFKNMLLAAVDACHKAYEHFPLRELILFFKKDPYHKIMVYLPKPALRDFYSSSLKLHVLAEIDQYMKNVKQSVMDKRIYELFKSHQMEPLENYKPDNSIDYASLQLSYFNHTRSLNLLYNYIAWYYKQNIREIVQIIGRIILAQNRINQNKLLNAASNVEDVEDKITAFDLSLSPESEDGKQLKRLKFNISQDTTQQKLFGTMVSQKDREARGLIERGIEGLARLAKTLEDLLNSRLESIREQLKTLYYAKSDNQTFEDVMKHRIRHIYNFIETLNQIMEMEKGN